MARIETRLALAAGGVAAAVWLCLRCRRYLTVWLLDCQRALAWNEMPEVIILLRHGEAEHNTDIEKLQYENPDRKPDNLCELTAKGRTQAQAAGEHIQRVLGDKPCRLSVIVSPFERTLQTLNCVQQRLAETTHIGAVHVDPRVREQEFGNYQVKDEMSRHKKDASEVGRFWYRRPTGESGADVYDRVTTLWDSIFSGYHTHYGAYFKTPDPSERNDALLIVTHGLTMRVRLAQTKAAPNHPSSQQTAPSLRPASTQVLLMRYFHWSPQTFDAVYNAGNCDTWVLRKQPGTRSYALSPTDSSPPRLPWATRQVCGAQMACVGQSE